MGTLLSKGFVGNYSSLIDACGVDGEYHSFVADAPFFANPISFKVGEKTEGKHHFKIVGENGEVEEITKTYAYADLYLSESS